MSVHLISDDMLAAPARHIFLSPHYDDIALSAGATARRLADLGRQPETVIVFGSEPDPETPLSTFAAAMHEGWGLGSSEVIGRRRAEEERAAEAIGAAVHLLPFHDAIYRGHTYLSDEDLFSQPSDAEHSVPQAIIAALGLPTSPTPDIRIYAPLGVGGHVDHQLVFTAAAHLAAAGWDIWLYEDVPYALRAGALAQRLDNVGQEHVVAPLGVVPAEAAWDAKIQGILSYPSQLETIFLHYVGVAPTRMGISDALTAYARKKDEKIIGEQFWSFANAPTWQGS
ncbi:MAG: PIG-L family deacetylase [Thermomicrobiales bacterium]|nr:PIG-L family deacetylase [Thermomicrobiales bacterium]